MSPLPEAIGRELMPLGLGLREARLFMMSYKFGLDEMLTKVNILKEELTAAGDDCPIEHVSSRLKTPESLARKMTVLGLDFKAHHVRDHISDIAGIRISCSFVSDVYKVAQMLTMQPDVTVVMVKDYIANPKPNGYKSLHLIVETPVHMSKGPQQVRVELQLRTVAMDFWASLEHKIFYKYDGQVPESLLTELANAAEVTSRLDTTMEQLHQSVHTRDADAADV